MQDLLAKMSVEEKVGQTVQGDIGSLTPDDVRKYRLGSALAGGNSDPGNDYHAALGQAVADPGPLDVEDLGRAVGGIRQNARLGPGEADGGDAS